MGIDPLNSTHPLTVPFLNPSESQTAAVRKGLNEVVGMQVEGLQEKGKANLQIQVMCITANSISRSLLMRRKW